MSDILTKMIWISKRKMLPHSRLPALFLDDDGQPKDFVGPVARTGTTEGFIDDRQRNANNYVNYAPRRIKSNMNGTGEAVHEDYPQSRAAQGWPSVLESTVPRQARGQKADTLTEVHDQRTTFDISVATFEKSGFPSHEDDTWTGGKNPTVTQTENPFNARYPYNHVRNTESGHLFEADDTPGAERFKEAHRMGTYYEIGPDGSRVTKIVRDDFTVIVGNENVNIQGSAIVTIEGDCNFYTKGNFTHQVDGDYNLLVKGKKTERVADDVVNDYHADHTLMVGRSIDPLRAGIGKGNEGGSYKVQVEGDHIFTTRGNVSQIYGTGITPISFARTVRGDEMDQVDGVRYEQTRGTRIDSVGGVRSNYTAGVAWETVDGARTTTINGLETQTFNLAKTQNVTGLATDNYNGAYISNTTGLHALNTTGGYTFSGTGATAFTTVGATTFSGGTVAVNGFQLTVSGGNIVHTGASMSTTGTITALGQISSSVGDVIAYNSIQASKRTLATHKHGPHDSTSPYWSGIPVA